MLNHDLQMINETDVNAELNPLLDSLLSVLRKEIEIYGELAQTIVLEGEVLLNASLETLHESNARKETCILKTRILEEIRMKAVSRIASHLGLAEGEISLSVLLSHASPEQRDQLMDCQSVLRALVAEIAGMNSRNGLLIESSIRFNESAVSFIANILSSGSTYADSGRLRTNGLNGRICSERG